MTEVVIIAFFKILGEDFQQTPSAWEQAELKPEHQYI